MIRPEKHLMPRLQINKLGLSEEILLVTSCTALLEKVCVTSHMAGLCMVNVLHCVPVMFVTIALSVVKHISYGYATLELKKC